MKHGLLDGSHRTRVTLVANPYSVHVLRWLKLFKLAEIDVRIVTAESGEAELPVEVPVEFLVPNWMPGPAAFRYLAGGVMAAIRRRLRKTLLHAHCTSGSGCMAWLSGAPYIVTTYGSEVFGAPDRGLLYRWMIGRVLRSAQLVTATTPLMATTLEEQFGVSPQRIRTFSLGYDSDVFGPAAGSQRDGLRRELGLPADDRVWVVNRRSLPLYRTLEVVSGFLAYCRTSMAGALVVLSGDDDPAYSRQVQNVIATSVHGARIKVIRQFLPAEGVARWLRAADFAISAPKTDQLSTSILEAMACGAIPVLSDLDAYRPLHACPAICRVKDCSAEGLAGMFAATGALPIDEIQRRQRVCAEFVARHYSEVSILNDVRALFDLPPLPVTKRRVAA